MRSSACWACTKRPREFFLRAVAARPDVPQYLFNLAATERMTGALKEAEAHCDAAIALDPRYGLAHYLRSDLRIQTPDRNHIAEMEALIRNGRLAQPSEIMLRFALGKECEDLDLHERAFDHVEAGCDLQHRSAPHDHAAGIAEIDRIIRTHTRSWIDSAPPGYSAAAPVFVAGLPRTGTTLVERIIASHAAMSSVGETGAFAVEMSRAMKDTATRADPAAIGRRYVDSATAFRELENVRFVDKTLQNYLYCGLIHAALPAARIILVQRHPLDACWAIYKAHFQGKFSFSYHQIELAEYYLAYRRLARHWRATLPPEVLLEINYEDIVQGSSGGEPASDRLCRTSLGRRGVAVSRKPGAVGDRQRRSGAPSDLFVVGRQMAAPCRAARAAARAAGARDSGSGIGVRRLRPTTSAGQLNPNPTSFSRPASHADNGPSITPPT